MFNWIKKILTKKKTEDVNESSLIVTQSINPDSFSKEKKDDDLKALQELDKKIATVERIDKADNSNPSNEDYGISVKNPFIGE